MLASISAVLARVGKLSLGCERYGGHFLRADGGLDALTGADTNFTACRLGTAGRAWRGVESMAEPIVGLSNQEVAATRLRLTGAI
jgi:hypothetical protein